jgi:hypothetical protein
MITKEDRLLIQGIMNYARRRHGETVEIVRSITRASEIIREHLVCVITPRHMSERYGAVKAVLNWDGTTVYTGTGTNIFPWR